MVIPLGWAHAPRRLFRARRLLRVAEAVALSVAAGRTSLLQPPLPVLVAASPPPLCAFFNLAVTRTESGR